MADKKPASKILKEVRGKMITNGKGAEAQKVQRAEQATRKSQ